MFFYTSDGRYCCVTADRNEAIHYLGNGARSVALKSMTAEEWRGFLQAHSDVALRLLVSMARNEARPITKGLRFWEREDA